MVFIQYHPLNPLSPLQCTFNSLIFGSFKSIYIPSQLSRQILIFFTFLFFLLATQLSATRMGSSQLHLSVLKAGQCMQVFQAWLLHYWEALYVKKRWRVNGRWYTTARCWGSLISQFGIYLYKYPKNVFFFPFNLFLFVVYIFSYRPPYTKKFHRKNYIRSKNYVVLYEILQKLKGWWYLIYFLSGHGGSGVHNCPSTQHLPTCIGWRFIVWFDITRGNPNFRCSESPHVIRFTDKTVFVDLTEPIPKKWGLPIRALI